MFSKRVTGLEPGVNIYGYVFAEHGVGQLVRVVVEIARQAGLDFSVIPYTETFSRQAVPFTDLGAGESVYDINIICVNADTVPKFVRHVGRELLEGRYNIGLWAWEVEDLPRWMAKSAKYLDEIWACSHFAAEAIARSVSCRVVPLPLPVSVPRPVAANRRDLGLSDDFLYLFCSDFNSIFERKNALAVIAAFRRAFVPGSGAKLLIKTINGGDFQHQLERLYAGVLGHPDIEVVDGYLHSDEQQLLMNTCDAYVSLHRSEGYGFTMAEAMALGKPVIATGYSGNMDFMTEENSYPVPYRLVAIPEGCDPYPTTSRWADPDVEAAAALMRRVFERRDEARRMAERAQRDILRWHTPEAKTRQLVDRLQAVREESLVPGSGAWKRRRSYTVVSYDAAGDGGSSAGRGEAERRAVRRTGVHTKGSHRDFESLRHLLENRLVKLVPEDVDPELVCGSLDGAKLDGDGGISVWGWAFDPRRRVPARGIALLLDGEQVPAQIPVATERQDVAAHLGEPGLAACGWSYYVSPRLLSTGENVFAAFALLEDGKFGRLSGEGDGRIVVDRPAESAAETAAEGTGLGGRVAAWISGR